MYEKLCEYLLRLRQLYSKRCSMKYIVDFQALKQPINKFVVKELAIHRVGCTDEPKVFFFRPPFDWDFLPARYKAENKWLDRNYHQINWNYGDYPYECIETILYLELFEAEAIFVKGREKLVWLSHYIDNVYNIEDIQNSVSLKVLRRLEQRSDVCQYHQESKTNCAAQNVLLIEKFLLNGTPS